MRNLRFVNHVCNGYFPISVIFSTRQSFLHSPSAGSSLLNSHVIQLLLSQAHRIAIIIFYICRRVCACVRMFARFVSTEYTVYIVYAHEFIARLMTAYHHQQYLHTPNPCHSFPLDLLCSSHKFTYEIYAQAFM